MKDNTTTFITIAAGITSVSSNYKAMIIFMVTVVILLMTEKYFE